MSEAIQKVPALLLLRLRLQHPLGLSLADDVDLRGGNRGRRGVSEVDNYIILFNEEVVV